MSPVPAPYSDGYILGGPPGSRASLCAPRRHHSDVSALVREQCLVLSDLLKGFTVHIPKRIPVPSVDEVGILQALQR